MTVHLLAKHVQMEIHVVVSLATLLLERLSSMRISAIVNVLEVLGIRAVDLVRGAIPNARLAPKTTLNSALLVMQRANCILC